MSHENTQRGVSRKQTGRYRGRAEFISGFMSFSFPFSSVSIGVHRWQRFLFFSGLRDS
jgi:hypothetical protein